jgi:hypothetical protein
MKSYLYQIVTLLMFLLLGGFLRAAQDRGKPLTNADVVSMVKAGLTDDVIIDSMSAQATNFDVSAAALLSLKKAGVSSKIMNAMLSAYGKEHNSQTSPTASPVGVPGSEAGGGGAVSSTPVPAPGEQDADRQRDISGTYVGRFRCGVGDFDLRLSMDGEDPTSLTAVFDFSPVFLQNTQRRFVYDLRGTYELGTRKFQLTPVKWESAPLQGFQMIGMKGAYDPASQRLDGKISNLLCGKFNLDRESQTPRPNDHGPAKR